MTDWGPDVESPLSKNLVTNVETTERKSCLFVLTKMLGKWLNISEDDAIFGEHLLDTEKLTRALSEGLLHNLS